MFDVLGLMYTMKFEDDLLGRPKRHTERVSHPKVHYKCGAAKMKDKIYGVTKDE